MSLSNDKRAPSRTKLLIVGGGPVGLTMALLLDRFGIDFVLVERAGGVTNHPKARGCDIRSMELFRQWGIGEKIKARGLPPGSDTFAMVDSISGREYGRTVPELDIGQSPAWRCLVAQDVVEEEIFDVIRASKPGCVLYDTEFTSYKDLGGDGVAVHTRDLKTGQAQEWRADYLIGADGAGSSVRRLTDITMRGPATLAVMANEFWQADLSHIPRVTQTAGYRVRPEDPRDAIWTVLNGASDRWLSAGYVGKEDDERPLPRTDAEVVALARKQTGIPNLEVKVISRSIWRLSRQVADKFRSGNVFLVGDAAHRFPPNGGFGMNSGIQDAHNLAWKMRLVFDGKAGAGLLDSYDVERRPIAESNADFSLGNQKRFLRTDAALRSGNIDEINFWIRDSHNHLHSSGQSLGFAYEEGAVVQDGTARVALQARRYEPSDRPGGRFPHWWTDLARTRSTLDWFDREFVLVAGPKAEGWIEAAAKVSEKTGLPIGVRQLDAANESDGIWLGLRGAVLVRPDGHVAWRMPWLPSDPVAELGSAVNTILCR